MSSRQTATKHCEVLGETERIRHRWKQAARYCHNEGFLIAHNYTSYLTENINQPAIDPASACHDAVTRELWQRETKMWRYIFQIPEEGTVSRSQRIKRHVAESCDPLPCFYPAPCRSQSSDAPRTCPTPQRTRGPAGAPVAPLLSTYPATHTTKIPHIEERNTRKNTTVACCADTPWHNADLSTVSNIAILFKPRMLFL